MKKSIYILLILIPLFYGCKNEDDTENFTHKNWLYTFNNYPLSDSLKDELYEMIVTNPDTVLKITTEILDEYPYSNELLLIRMSTYFELKNYTNCKADLIKIIILNPDEKYTYLGILDYLNCKIITNGDCRDSTIFNNSTYTITITDDYFSCPEDNDTSINYDFIIE